MKNFPQLNEFKVVAKLIDGYHKTTKDLINKLRVSQEKFKDLEDSISNVLLN
jgi:hypothetical protein